MPTRKRSSLVFIICSIVLFVLISFAPMYGWRLREWLSEGGVAPSAVSGQADAATLAAQNEALQAELAQLQSVAAQIPQNPQGGIRAMVYVPYPFGFKNELLVNAGSNERVATGSAVLFQGVFIGTAIRVFPDSAIVQTVFDPSFRFPVRIGANGVDALLVGGADPKATSIAKNSAIASGDIVVTAASGFPYGLPVGVVDATTTSADNLFQEASLNFAYDINSIQTVVIEP